MIAVLKGSRKKVERTKNRQRARERERGKEDKKASNNSFHLDFCCV